MKYIIPYWHQWSQYLDFFMLDHFDHNILATNNIWVWNKINLIITTVFIDFGIRKHKTKSGFWYNWKSYWLQNNWYIYNTRYTHTSSVVFYAVVYAILNKFVNKNKSFDNTSYATPWDSNILHDTEYSINFSIPFLFCLKYMRMYWHLMDNYWFDYFGSGFLATPSFRFIQDVPDRIL